MINSRSLDDLTPATYSKALAFRAACDAAGIDLLVTSTYRDHESQAALYAQGRTAPGKIVTNAKPGQSWHNWRCAMDVVPLRNGKPVWSSTGEDAKLWQRVGELGESVGLEWAGRWKSFRELAHFQNAQGKTIAELQAGAKLA